MSESTHPDGGVRVGRRVEPTGTSLSQNYRPIARRAERPQRAKHGCPASRTESVSARRSGCVHQPPARRGSSTWGHGPRGRLFRRRGLADVLWPEPVCFSRTHSPKLLQPSLVRYPALTLEADTPIGGPGGSRRSSPSPCDRWLPGSARDREACFNFNAKEPG